MSPHPLSRRILLDLAALVLGILLLEGVLQLGALAIRVTASDRLSGLQGGTRILCIGDSNTFGVYVDPDESYPRQLEARWARDHPSDPLEVANVGFPGMNSSGVRRDLEEMLDAFRPSQILLMIGVNDFWTLPVEGDRRSPGAWIAHHSRLARLWFSARRALESTPALEVLEDPDRTWSESKGRIRYGSHEFKVGFSRGRAGPDERIALALRENLEAIAAAARDRGTGLALLTYASREARYGQASELIVRASEETGTPLIDIASAFAQACPAEPCPELLFFDHHPTARGYAIVADAVASWLETQVDD